MFHLPSTPNVRRWLSAGARPHPTPHASAAGAVLDRVTPERPGPRLTDPPGEDHDAGVIYHGSRPAMAAADWSALGFSDPQASRLANLRSPTGTRASIVIMTADGVAPLRHYPFHSPTGFEWGYSGSGPADLARCILLHHFGVTPTSRGKFYPPAAGELPVGYQAFKFDVIARLEPDAQWALTSQQISGWIEAHR